MTFYLRSLLFCLTVLVFAPFAFAAETAPVDTGEAVGQIVTSHNVVTPGQTLAVAAALDLNPGWHIYWKNPGDSGEPFDTRFTPSSDYEVGDIEWPIPGPQPTGPIINYGYEGRPLFPQTLTISEDVQPGDTVTISGLVYYLICADICIPESFEFSLDLPVAAQAQMDNRWNANIERARRKMPTKADWPATAALMGEKLVVEVILPSGFTGEDTYFFPTLSGFINHSDHPQNVIVEDGLARFTLTPEYELSDGIKDIPFLFKWFEGGEAEAVYLTAQGGNISAGGLPIANASGVNTYGTGIGLGTALFFALIGGIILNLMPCVFPVIALKALHVAGLGGEDRKRVQFEAWVYTAGVIACFAALVGLLIVLRNLGQSIGWGIHLQSPVVTGLLALLFVAIALNLLGVFEFGTRFQGAGQSLTEGGGARASFFTGLLAVIVATPCTAPLMAPAVGWAFGQSTLTLLTVMLTLGFGFALPFLLLAYLPANWLRLPKPGAWMDTFKQILAFPMFAAAIWLVFVVTAQTGLTGLVYILSAALILAFGLWCLRRERLWGKLLGFIAIFIALAIPVSMIWTKPQPETATKLGGELSKTEWSADAIAQERAKGRAVFVDFTAAWCVTCKVNERGALSDPAVIAAFADTDTAFMVADWTLKDDIIAAELARHGRAGVPLYLYYRPLKAGEVHNDVNPQILPQILTVSMLQSTLTGG